MKVVEQDGAIERQVVTAFITNSDVLARFSDSWGHGKCESTPANVVTKLCVNYYRKYGKAPDKHIKTLFAHWSESKANQASVELTASYLATLSDEYEQATPEEQNGGYLIDLAAKFFTRTKTKKLIEQLQGCILNDDLTNIPVKINDYLADEVTDEEGTNVLEDTKYSQEIYNQERRETLIEFPGYLGNFFGQSLHRKAFINFMGAEKRGKSFFLMDLAWRAMLQRRKVLYFGVGDMDIPEMLERFYARAAGRPIVAGTVYYPTKIVKPKEPGKGYIVEREERTYDDPMTYEEGRAAFEKVAKYKVRSKNSYFRLYFHPSDTCSVSMIDAEIGRQQRKGFVPDICVIDYADILAPPPGILETREQINATWKAMRKLSQERQVLLLTATQAPTSSYESAQISRKHISNDKRKRAHVTGEIGINQSREEEEQGIYRLNWVVRRRERNRSGYQVRTASCLEVMNPAVLSSF